MTWPVSYEPHVDLLVRGRIDPVDAERQSATAREILKRFERQPGLVLADEVGMGKTFVALAVATMVARADRQSRPVVVMVPPALKEKWPRDFEVFRERCLSPAMARAIRGRVAADAVSFFRLLDDEPSKRAHIIFLSHGALHNALQDPWVKFAILKRALSTGRLESQRNAFPRFAASFLRLSSKGKDERYFAELLASPTHSWREIMTRHGEDPGDDPVPEGIRDVLRAESVRLEALRDELERMPLRGSENLEERLSGTRKALVVALKDVWAQALKAADFRSPLLILDEAHHVKNPATRLASLFVDADSESDAQLLDGALSRRFERMLFLTATPFQLGHHELLNVLGRFQGIAWANTKILMSQQEFATEIAELDRRLDAAQCTAVDLDQKWKLVKPEDVGADPDRPEALEEWWGRVVERPDDQPEKMQMVHRAYQATARTMAHANDALRPWVIRHLRPRSLVGTRQLRRALWTGESIATGRATDTAGLQIRDESILPFLLAARCQTIVTRLGEQSSEVSGRITFAEGLASSYEAFLETRALAKRRNGEVLALDEDEALPAAPEVRSRRLDWYFNRLQQSLPAGSTFAQHPKVQPTVERALDLWDGGEKVLVFCHFRQTGKALEQHLSTALQDRLLLRARDALKCGPEEAEKRLDALGDRFEPGRPLHRELQKHVSSLLEDASALTEEERDHVFEVVRRFVRTASFLVRYFPLERTQAPDLLKHALAKPDHSGLSLSDKIAAFARFMVDRCTAVERSAYLGALENIVTGTRRGLRSADVEAERLPNIRLVNGGTGWDERKRLMLAFNAPFFPEILVASSVMAEGVDLHLECRHIIHHDLCWNPSTLEQRTGRVDRIGAKAERVTQPINVYLPFVAGTQDEKMFRVVRDRERWFQVLMGDDYKVDDITADRIASRVPLPERAARELAMRLEVQRSKERAG